VVWGDVLFALVLIAIGIALAVLGAVWGRWRAVPVVGLLYSAPLVLLDALYFGLGLNLGGYCGEPKCDPGPLPLSLLLIALPIVLALTALGVLVRRAAR
jgi:hypothetical protein